MRRRRDVFPPDRALQARMGAALLAAAAFAVLLVAVLGWLAAAVQWRLAAGAVLFAAGGLAAEAGTRGRGTRARTSPLAPRDERRARELLVRLAALGGVRCPRLVFEADDAPLSWTTAVPWRQATIHVTSGLLCGCATRELESVLAHELTHIANHDAWVMTMVGPPSWILTGIRDAWRERRGSPLRHGIGIAAISWMAALALPGALAAGSSPATASSPPTAGRRFSPAPPPASPPRCAGSPATPARAPTCGSPGSSC